MNKAEAYKIVFEDLSQCRMFRGHYDAKNGGRMYMNGILTVMEALAYRAGEAACADAFVSLFIDNMIKSEEKANSNHVI